MSCPQEQQIQRDLEAPLLDNASDVEIHSAIPLDNNVSEITVVDDEGCKIINKIYFLGFLVGIAIQSCSLYAFGIVTPSGDGETKIQGDHSIPFLFALYFFSRYWILAALLLPPIVFTMGHKSRKLKLARGSKDKKDLVKSNLESFFQCIRFQLGMFFGSLILLSLVNFYALAQTAPICMLLGYYAICVFVSLIALCLLQLFVNQVCGNISSVEIIVSYDNDDE
mmetsp:Transcript_10689/g.25724  ORF Transcript_10689/g.25724 Transcript_10689/m.25724 type:complete len:224 (-) Transcript_10689:288-959(-)